MSIDVLNIILIAIQIRQELVLLLDASSLYWKETKYNLDSFRGKLYFRHLNRSEAFVAQEYSVRVSRIL